VSFCRHKEPETMKLLTCYNQDLQRYNYKLTAKDFSRDRKNELLAGLKEIIHKTNRSFYKVFPDKKRQVVDEIYYLLTGSGINTIHTRTLMKKFGIKSRTTIVEAVAEIKASGQVLVCRLGNGHAGTYVFVLKDHPNFKEIMREVFFVEVAENEPNEQPFEQQNEHLQNSKTVETVSVEVKKTDPINLISLSFKQVSNNIQKFIEDESLDIKDLKQELEYLDTYTVNEYQIKMYHYIKAKNFHEQIEDHAVILGLRVGSNCSARDFFVAKTIVKTMNRWIENGMEIGSIPGLFSDQYEKELKDIKKRQIQEPTKHESPLPFYNWLEEDLIRESDPAVKVAQEKTQEHEQKKQEIEEMLKELRG
jgi:hypothetical protein